MTLKIKFSHLFSPGHFGKLELKNRIIMPAVGTGFAGKDGKVTEQITAYFAARAKGGAALIITETATIITIQGAVIKALDISGNDSIPGLKTLVKAIHKFGAKAGIQLWHPGRQATPILCGNYPAIAPSSIPCPVCKVVPRELSIDEIKEVVKLYGDAAVRAAEAGYDVVEIHAAHGYLISEFLSPAANIRTDEYGGSVQGRVKFLLEIVHEIRKRLGPEFPLSCRINGADYVSGGAAIEDAKAYAKHLAKAGVDVISVSAGMYGSYPAIIPPVMEAPGCYVELAGAVRAEVTIPVIATGRINNPSLAENILQTGKADFVAIGRGLVADPDFPQKAMEGKEEEICYCMGCNKLCADINNTGSATAIGCAVNPVAGKEHVCNFSPAKKAKKVVVIGGGPAGLKAAQVAALRGHQVILCEKESSLGGQLRLASVPPGKGEFMRTVSNLQSSLLKTNLEIKMGLDVGFESLKSFNPDVVIIATGAKPIIPPIPGIKLPNVMSAHAVLRGEGKIGRQAVVIGGGGVGLETAVHLAGKGHKVTVIEMMDTFGRDMGPIFRWYTKMELNKYGVVVRTSTKVVEIDNEYIVLEQENGDREQLETETVVYAVGSKANNELAVQLEGHFNYYLIGDAKNPRSAADAITEGWELAIQL